jgi:hypothetical protein
MRSMPSCNGVADLPDRFFLLDTGVGFL